MQKHLASLTDETKAYLRWMWRGWWARPEQLAPDGNWRTWAYIAGRGAGKTRSGSEWVREQVKAGVQRIALIAPTSADARDVMIEGDSGILSVCSDQDTTENGTVVGLPVYEPSKRRLTWANGAIATAFSAEESDRLRGPQFGALWCDELAGWKDGKDVWDMAQFGLRLGSDPRAIVTTTPKPNALIRSIMFDETTVVTRGTTYDNAANLAAPFLETIKNRYEGTRLGRQEIFAELLDDFLGALWSRHEIDKHRVNVAPDMQRIVVAVDPSGTAGVSDDGDDIGIVVAGLGVDNRGYVIADHTCKLSPSGWGRRAVDAYNRYQADVIVAERNFGGAMVEHVIRTVDPKVSYKEVTASRGKVVRAEPVAALYEQGKVSHVGNLDELEDQMCMIGATGYIGEGSPDRADALVWALDELMLGHEPSKARVFL